MAGEDVNKLAMSDEDEFFEETETETEGSEEGSEEGAEEEEASTENEEEDESEENEGTEESEESDEESEESEEEGEGQEEEEGSGEEDKDKDEKTAAELLLDLDDESTEEGTEGKEFDYKAFASSLDIELETDSKEELVEKINARIDKAKSQVDVSKFSPEAQKLVRHLHENDGQLTDFFSNSKITDLQGVVSMEPEEKVRMLKGQEFSKEGLSGEEIEEKLNEYMSDLSVRQIVDAANKIDQNAKDLINAEIQSIIGSREEQVAKQKAESDRQIAIQRENLKNFVQKQDDFLGMKLSPRAKQTMIGDIDSGKFDSLVDVTDNEVRFTAYMIKRAGGRLKKQIENLMAEKNREGYNNAVDKTTRRLHKKTGDASGRRSGHEDASGKEGMKNFDRFADIE